MTCLAVRRAASLAFVLVACAPPSSAPPPVAQPAPAQVAPAAAPPASQVAIVPPPREDGRLPAGVAPTGYRWEVAVDPERARFSGRMRIAVRVDAPTRAVVLHGRGLDIRSAVVEGPFGAIAATAAFRSAAHARGEADELVLTTAQPVPAGDASLDLVYEAPFAEGLHGLYRTIDRGKAYAVTQLEPIGARLAFPCFDEPSFKVPFEIAVTIPKDLVALSNMPEARRTPGPDGSTVTAEFARSPPLPTYLVALAVGPFEIRTGASAGVVPIRLGAEEGRTALGTLALATARDHLGVLESYFGIPYAYPKLDLLAVPNFGAGAMENAGLVTFREERLLLDPRTTSTTLRRTAVSVIAHELAHMWFGDLVTLAWWNDIWLNEGFATWMAAHVLDTWRPDMEAGVDALGSTAQVLDVDTLTAARKVRQPVRSTTEALEAFDGITYDKGAALLRMVEQWVTPEAFQRGVRAYLAEHRFGNATAEDLFAALGTASGQDVAGVLGTFTEQTGVPAVELSACRLEKGSPVIDVTEREYRPLGAPAPTGKVWRAPVCVHYGGDRGGSRACTLAGAEPVRWTLPGNACPRWLHPNADQAGYYRATETLEGLTELARLPRGVLQVRERVGVLLDAWALVESGAMAAGDFLALAERFRGDPEQAVWQRIVEPLELLDDWVVPADARPALAAFARRLLGPEARALGWEARPGERDGDRMRRRIVLEGLGRVGRDEATLAEARAIADKWLANPDAVDGDAAAMALPLASADGGAALFGRFLARLRGAKTPTERVLALSAIGAFGDPALVRRALDLVVDGTVRSQDQQYIFRAVFGRPAPRAEAFAYVAHHTDAVLGKIPPFNRGRAIPTLARSCSDADGESARALFEPRLGTLEGADRGLAVALESTHRCAALRAHHAAPLGEWLSAAAKTAH
jgi:alanyl aminopeptidase